jgi:hypothetical protein
MSIDELLVTERLRKWRRPPLSPICMSGCRQKVLARTAEMPYMRIWVLGSLPLQAAVWFAGQRLPYQGVSLMKRIIEVRPAEGGEDSKLLAHDLVAHPFQGVRDP